VARRTYKKEAYSSFEPFEFIMEKHPRYFVLGTEAYLADLELVCEIF
jgi:hypothetical protein